MKIGKKWLFFPALAIGVVGLVLAINLKPDLPTKPAGDRAPLGGGASTRASIYGSFSDWFWQSGA